MRACVYVRACVRACVRAHHCDRRAALGLVELLMHGSHRGLDHRTRGMLLGLSELEDGRVRVLW